eukprot:CAMPEP_0115241534 /NCGR_PEP_ID=MMETSP0270-20121206/38479_1 /TAXON_ID=71861 /ORGANISM="Scrippsiella trochoidea, Strain CCMP3099" /LENGTH=475 /DNA_ID=CAMNT_0002656557 /DNA_START=46 /DNA_END=1473 /DNA_ORIENTATION=+
MARVLAVGLLIGAAVVFAALAPTADFIGVPVERPRALRCVAASAGPEAGIAVAEPSVTVAEPEASAPAPAPAQVASTEADGIVGQWLQTQRELTRQAVDVVAGLPSWQLFAPAAVVALFTAVSVAITAITAPPPRPAGPAAVRAPATAVVLKAETSQAPSSAPRPAATLSRPAPAPVPVPAPAPAPAPAQAPVRAPAAPVATKPSPSAATEFNLARTIAGATASGLRAAADLLPQAELALERQAPALEGGLRTVAAGKPEETLPVVGRAVATGAEAAARTGLKVASTGLGVAAETLPSAAQAVNFVVEAAMPSVMSGAHASADAARAMATQMSSPGNLPANTPDVARQVLPVLFNGAAAGLDMLIDGAPAAKQAVSYAAEKALPIVQSALRVSSEVSGDAASMPLPDSVQVTKSLKSVGIDPERLAAEAGDLARQAAAKAAERLPVPPKTAAAPLTLVEPSTVKAAAVVADVAKP